MVQTNDLSKKATYDIKYKVSYTNYPSVFDTVTQSVVVEELDCKADSTADCDDKVTEKFEPIPRPYFEPMAADQLQFTLKVGQSWTWPIPEPQHEDDSTDEHTFAIKVQTEMPMHFMDYFKQTLILDIAKGETTIDDVGVYDIRISLKDEKNVTSSEPLVLKITISDDSEATV